MKSGVVQALAQQSDPVAFNVIQRLVTAGMGVADGGASISCTLPQEEINVLPGDVVKHLSVVSTQFEKNVKTYVRASGQLEGATNEVK